MKQNLQRKKKDLIGNNKHSFHKGGVKITKIPQTMSILKLDRRSN